MQIMRTMLITYITRALHRQVRRRQCKAMQEIVLGKPHASPLYTNATHRGKNISACWKGEHRAIVRDQNNLSEVALAQKINAWRQRRRWCRSACVSCVRASAWNHRKTIDEDCVWDCWRVRLAVCNTFVWFCNTVLLVLLLLLLSVWHECVYFVAKDLWHTANTASRANI